MVTREQLRKHYQERKCRRLTYYQQMYKAYMKLNITREDWTKTSRIWPLVLKPLVSRTEISRVDFYDVKATFHLNHITQPQWDKCFEQGLFGETVLCKDDDSRIRQLILSRPYVDNPKSTDKFDLTFTGVRYLIQLLLEDPRNRNILFEITQLKIFKRVKRGKKKEKKSAVIEDREEFALKGKAYIWRKSSLATPTTTAPFNDILQTSSVGCFYLDSNEKRYIAIMKKLLDTFVTKLWVSIVGQKHPQRKWIIHGSHLNQLKEQTKFLFGEENNVLDKESTEFVTLFSRDTLRTFHNTIPTSS